MFQWYPATTPVIANLLLTGGSGAIDVTSEYNHDQRQNYHILYDKMATGGLLDGGGAQKIVHDVYNFKGEHADCQMDAASATTGTNQIWIILISDIAAATYPTFKYTFKVFFTDS